MADMKNRIAELRQQKGLSLRALQEQSGVTHSTIARAEHEGVGNLAYEKISKLASALGVSVPYLVGDTDTLDEEEITTSTSEARSLLNGFHLLPREGQILTRRILALLLATHHLEGGLCANCRSKIAESVRGSSPLGNQEAILAEILKWPEMTSGR